MDKAEFLRKIEILAAEGNQPKAIATALQMNPSKFYCWLAETGHAMQLDHYRLAPLAPLPFNPKAPVAEARTHENAFSREELNTIRALGIEGLNTRTIAPRFNMSERGLRLKLAKSGWKLEQQWCLATLRRVELQEEPELVASG